MAVAMLARVPVRIASHHGYIEGAPVWRIKLHGWMINNGFAHKLVAVSERVRQIAIEEEGVRPELIHVIQNGIKPIVPDKSREQMRVAHKEEFKLKPGDFIYLSIGRLTVQKGHIYLLEAALEVLNHFSGHSVFLIAGEGHLHDFLKQKAIQLGIQESVHFLGNREDITELLTLADVFVLPSVWEGLPLALLEAMSAGLPIIATSVEGVENVIQDGENGYLLQPKDVKALADAMIGVQENPDTLRRMGNHNLILVREEFTVERMCKKYEELFLGSEQY
jgi:glycosyltransferase involved in cell wall biosynthesis